MQLLKGILELSQLKIIFNKFYVKNITNGKEEFESRTKNYKK